MSLRSQQPDGYLSELWDILFESYEKTPNTDS